MLLAAGVLAVNDSFADQGDGDGDDSEDERLLAANSVNDEGDEDQV